jgi:hypothetical protein
LRKFRRSNDGSVDANGSFVDLYGETVRTNGETVGGDLDAVEALKRVGPKKEKRNLLAESSASLQMVDV